MLILRNKTHEVESISQFFSLRDNLNDIKWSKLVKEHMISLKASVLFLSKPDK